MTAPWDYDYAVEQAWENYCDDTGQDRDDSDAFNAWQADMEDRRTDDLIDAAEWDRMYPEVVA